MTTGEFAAACSVEKRTLFYYDEIGLLKPARVLENGYREYELSQLSRMETIKLLQSAGLSLTEIKSVLLCEGDGKNIEVVMDCKRRVEENIARLKDGLSYMNQRLALRECYLSHMGEELFVERFKKTPLSIIRPEYHSHMRITYMNMGHYLCIAEDVNSLRPRFFFKHTDVEEADTFLSEGNYVCLFIEQSISEGIFLPPYVEKFSVRLKNDGYSVGDIVYVEDLPAWMMDKRDMLIIRLAAKLMN